MDMFLVAGAFGTMTAIAGFLAGTALRNREKDSEVKDAVLLTDYWMAEAEAAQVRVKRLEVANTAYGKLDKSQHDLIIKLERMIADMTPDYEAGGRYRKSQAAYNAKKKAERATKVVA